MLAALGHFCEFHGPALVMVTQGDAHINDPLLVAIGDNSSPELQSECPSRILAAARAQEQVNFFSYAYFYVVQVSPLDCDGCRSLSGFQSFLISKENDESCPNSRTWVSSQAPLAPKLVSMVRHAVLRAISCEVIPAKEGPVLFSSASSSVLSHAFSLRDSRARGSRRQYAILLLSKERHPLVQHWAVLQARVQDIITSLQKKAEGKYEMDCKSLAELKEKCDYVREPPTKSTKSFSRRRASFKPARGLREVTQDEQVFEGMHQDLVTVLALAERCLKEQVLSGQPLLSSVRGSGTTPLAVVRDIMGQVPEMGCRLLLYRLLSGQSIQVQDQQYQTSPHLFLQVHSDQRHLARATSHGLCVLLPHNLAASPTCFANLVLTGTELEQTGPGLQVANGPSYTFFSGKLACTRISVSSIVNNFCRILSKVNVPVEIQEMQVRTEVERVLLLARTFAKVEADAAKKSFLARSGLETADLEILNFFQMFS